MHTFSLFALLHTQALERQKEFFDSVRSERDDLREEVVMLKEELKVGNQRTVKKNETSRRQQGILGLPRMSVCVCTGID